MEKDCPNCKFELYEADEIPCKDCGIDDREYWQPKPKTNADRIRAMSDEELAELFHGFCDNGERCVYCPLYEKSCAGVYSDVPKWLEWLQQPAEGE